MTTAVSIAQSGNNNTTFRNRIINGAMMIDQRNAGASVTPTDAQYTLDRWMARLTQSGKFTVRQTPSATETGYATRIAAGFTNYLAVTSTSAYSVTSTDLFYMQQRIEGLNTSDLAWGTANAQTVTLSFLVNSSLTGTFGGTVINSAADRSYPFSFSVPVANTWTQISVTIPGPTSGAWLTTNGIGLSVVFSLGAGSTYSGTANTWASTFYLAPTGATSVVGTSGATFYVTGVQFEKGSAATPFEQRLYGTELALCQRYFEKSGPIDTAAQVTGAAFPFVTYQVGSSTSIVNGSWYQTIVFTVTKRASPTVTTFPYTTPANTNRWSNQSGSDYGANSASVYGGSDKYFSIYNNSGSTLTSTSYIFGGWFASAEL